jgi:hypothetical protein
MERIDLCLEADRLRVALRVFNYPASPHRRKHGPDGYEKYESYRDWLRDEFSYRCVFSLVRETWIGKSTAFDIDHFQPQTTHGNLVCSYDNLLYLTHRLNLKKGKRTLPDPCSIALGQCLQVEPEGEQIGEISARNHNEVGRRIINVLRLNSDDATAERRMWLKILRSLAQTDETTFRELIGYPAALPNLRKKDAPTNSRQSGIDRSAQVLRDEKKSLPDWY